MGFKEDLRQIAEEEIMGIPINYRCHEGARQIGAKMKSLGVNTVIKDGIATYDTSFLQIAYAQLNFPELLEELPEDARGELLSDKKAAKKINVFHSWCEAAVPGQTNMTVIDWHPHLRLSQDTSLANVLIVDDKKELPHRYNPLGMQVGNLIIFKALPPAVTKLRK